LAAASRALSSAFPRHRVRRARHSPDQVYVMRPRGKASRSRDAQDTVPRPGIRTRALSADSDQPAVPDQPGKSIGPCRQSVSHEI
jgi:hypothetical protein